MCLNDIHCVWHAERCNCQNCQMDEQAGMLWFRFLLYLWLSKWQKKRNGIWLTIFVCCSRVWLCTFIPIIIYQGSRFEAHGVLFISPMKYSERILCRKFFINTDSIRNIQTYRLSHRLQNDKTESVFQVNFVKHVPT